MLQFCITSTCPTHHSLLVAIGNHTNNPSWAIAGVSRGCTACSLSLLCARRHAHKYACVCVLLSGLHFNSYIYKKCVFGLKNVMMSHSLAEWKLFECMREKETFKNKKNKKSVRNIGNILIRRSIWQLNKMLNKESSFHRSVCLSNAHAGPGSDTHKHTQTNYHWMQCPAGRIIQSVCFSFQ